MGDINIKLTQVDGFDKVVKGQDHPGFEPHHDRNGIIGFAYTELEDGTPLLRPHVS